MPNPRTLLMCLALLAWRVTGDILGQAPPPLLEFQVIFTEKGPTWTSDRSPALDSLQQAHQAFRLRLITEGKLMVAGPFETRDRDQLRGMSIACRLSREEVIALLAADPKVRTGHLVNRVVTWYVPATATSLARCGLPVSTP